MITNNEQLREFVEKIRNQYGYTREVTEEFVEQALTYAAAEIERLELICNNFKNGRPAVESKPLELMTRDELLHHIKNISVEDIVLIIAEIWQESNNAVGSYLDTNRIAQAVLDFINKKKREITPREILMEMHQILEEKGKEFLSPEELTKMREE